MTDAEGGGRRATCRSCRTTASTGTASRSPWCSPRRRSRPTTPPSLIRVDLRRRAGATSFAAAKAQGTRRPAAFMGEPLKIEIGDAEAALAAAPHRVDATYRTPRHNHNAIELHAATRRLGRRRADRPRRLAGAWRTRLVARAGVRHRREPGARHLALRRRRLRRQDAVAAPDPRRGGGEAGRAAGADRRSRARASTASSAAARYTEQRVALGAEADGTLRGADPHRHRRR